MNDIYRIYYMFDKMEWEYQQNNIGVVQKSADLIIHTCFKQDVNSDINTADTFETFKKQWKKHMFYPLFLNVSNVSADFWTAPGNITSIYLLANGLIKVEHV